MTFRQLTYVRLYYLATITAGKSFSKKNHFYPTNVTKNIFHLVNDIKQENYFGNGFLAPINIQIVVLHVDVVLIETKISHYLFQITGFSGHIGFCAYRPPGDYHNLFAVVFENLIPIPNTMPNCKNLSPSAQFLWLSFQIRSEFPKSYT